MTRPSGGGLRRRGVTALAAVALGVLALVPVTRRRAEAAPPAPSAHDHAHPAASTQGVSPFKFGRARFRAPSAKQIEKRLERIRRLAAKRTRDRPQRAKDRRRALRRRMMRGLRGFPLTPGMVDELRTHAKRRARLRRIRELAAEAHDYPTVAKVDMVLAMENARHQRWMQKQRRAARDRALAATRPSASASAAPAGSATGAAR